MRRGAILVLGGVVGTICGLVVWVAVTAAVIRVVVHYYPPSDAGPVTMPSDEHINTICWSFVTLPVAVIGGGYAGVVVAGRCVRERSTSE
jgi:hypothetical protein